MSKLSVFEDALEQEIANHSIYVWGGSGQLCCQVTEDWIRQKESRCENGKHADDAVAAWKAVMDSQYRNVARCFDCSGYVSYCLIAAKALDKRRDCDGLYARCNPTDNLENGTLLFRVNKSDPNDETHVGVYFRGHVYESKGRKYGVVRSSYKSKEWAKMGWFKTLEHENPDTEYGYEIKVYGSVRVRKGNGVLSKKIATVKNCTLPYLGQAVDKPNWYMTKLNGQFGYITNNPKYTKIVEVEW